MSTGIKSVYGTAVFNSEQGPFKTVEEITEVLDLLKKYGINELDTARLYGDSETLLGQTPSRKDFIISTKWLGGAAPGRGTKENTIADAKDSLKKVDIEQFDIFLLHASDTTIPFADTLEGVNEAYKLGIFKRFGLSNFTPEQVQEVYDIAKSKGWVLPTVFQGNYNAVARHYDTTLFPLLRKLGIAFYAYSPIAGGFLVKTKEQILAGESRWNKDALGGLYSILYAKPVLLESLTTWGAIAEKEGISKAELAYRWVAYNSSLKAEFGDAVIFGATSLKQIDQTTKYLKAGPLSKEAVDSIDQIWETVKSVAPVDNFAAFTASKKE